MNGIIGFSVRHYISVFMFLIAFIICAVISAVVIQVDFLPKMNDRYLLINADFSGIRADEMKKLVTKPLEDSVSSIKGIKNISSVTRDGISLITLELHWRSDIDMALAECRQMINRCYESLPSGCEKPGVRIVNPHLHESMLVAIIPKDGDFEYARYIIDNDIKGRFSRVKGVSQVSVTGGEKSEVHVIADKDKMTSFSLSLQSVADALSHSNFEYPAGTIKDGNKEILFKTDGLFASLDEIRNMPVLYKEGSVVRLSDFAEIERGIKEKQTCSFYNGKECICLNIYRKNETSPLVLSKNIKDEVTGLKKVYGTSYEFETVSDSSIELVESIKQLGIAVLVGVFITIVMLLLFFKSIKISLVASSIMPLTILFSLLVLVVTGSSLNTMSISGIAIGIGMVSDATTVAIENILAHLKKKGNIEEIIFESVRDVSGSAISSTLTTAVVFIPFFFLPDLTGALFSNLALAIISSISFACLLSLTYVPAILCALLKRQSFREKLINKNRRSIKENKFERKYEELLGKTMRIKFFVPCVVFCCIICTIFLLRFLKKEILPDIYSDTVNAIYYFEEGTPLEVLQKNGNYIDSYINQNDMAITTAFSIGIEPDDYTLLSDPQVKKERLYIKCTSKQPNRLKEYFVGIGKESGLEYVVDSGRNIVQEVLASDYYDSIIVNDDVAVLNGFIKKNALAKSEYIPNRFVTEYVFRVDRNACARFSVSALEASTASYNALEGVTAGIFYSDGRDLPIRVQLKKGSITSIDDLNNIRITTGTSYIPLSVLGDISLESCEKIYFRYNKQDAKKVATKTLRETSGSIQTINLEQMQMNDILNSTKILLGIVLVLLYCVMGSQFESFAIPFFMLLAVPPAFFGAFFALFVFKQSLNINTVIALVVLFGTAVNNSILLYENIKQHNGRAVKEVIQCCKEKLRAITITTLTSVCALIPFAIDPLHKNAQSSMALAIAGGLTVSYIVVLIIISPILFKFLKQKE